MPPTLNSQPTGPPTFRDAEGHEWRIRLTLGLIETVVDETGVDLIPNNCDVSTLTGLLFDPRKLSRVLWVCIAKAAAEEGVAREAFIDSLDGETLSLGWNALVESVLFFTRSQSVSLAAALEEAIETAMKFLERGTASLVQTMRSEETEAMIDQTVADAGRQLQNGLATAMAKSMSGVPVMN